PLAIVGLMTFAVVFSPLPSAPIALAAGAIYGHVWGTVYVIAGAELGALVAFALARCLGRDALRRWPRATAANAFLDRFMRSQNALTFAVFASRLMPFLSFDVVSYAAGLTPLAAWRFAGATLAGVAPASFALAHVGGVAASGEFAYGGALTLALGILVLSPFLWKALPRRWRR
ncbi:MAG: VTT domain-containing protein, partial [Amphiplicatus sp.]